MTDATKDTLYSILREHEFIWTFLLQMLASAVIQIILRWWQERASHRVLLVTMKAELTR